MPIVFITGSGKRIGRALALAFAKNKWDVIVHYNTSDSAAIKTSEQIKLLGSRSVSVKADLRSKSEIVSAFKTGIKELGIPRVLINNAGVFPEIKSLHEISEVEWDDTININLKAQFLCSQVFAEFAEKNSKIINISSLGGLEIWKKRIPYNVSKAGVIQLTKALAKELAPDIAVNCVCPGAISQLGESSDIDTNLIDVHKIPMKRYGTVKDVFDAVYYFSNSSMYITGQILTVDGGYHNSK